MAAALYTQLITRFGTGALSLKSLHENIMRQMQSNPGTNLHEILSTARTLLHSGVVDAEQFREVSELITEINIQQAAEPDSSPTLKNRVDQTLIMRTPNGAARDETLVMPEPPPKPKANAPSLSITRPQKTSRGTDHENRVKLGDVLKDRFELVELISHGGMGLIYKARDLVKIKARDSNPYLAVKVLSEEFKKHSRSFIALQREASRAQRLAHPNIATVYDFDHDGSIVYMTMELLQGRTFEELLAEKSSASLPTKTAISYIMDMCQALAYAHKQDLVHCDMKPANIFLCNNGTVKLLDFGITRAFKKNSTKQDDTLFDPATLKALTPAYASLEMFRGDPPDPRDDIYALACVAYELLTGKHPYKKVAAHQALELNLKPPPVKGLSRKQQNTLSRALALERSERLPSVAEFLEGIQPPQSHAKELSIAGTAILLFGGILLFNSLQTHWREEKKLDTIEAIQSGDEDRLAALLDSLNGLKTETREYYIFRLRKEIITYYEKSIIKLGNTQSRRHYRVEATRLLREAKQLYPDSAKLKEIETKIRSAK